MSAFYMQDRARLNMRAWSLRGKKTLIALCCGATLLSPAAFAQNGYVGIFGGGPFYIRNANNDVSKNVTEIANSGFTEVIVWNIEVKSNGDLNFNGEFPLTSNGAYIGNNTWPLFASDLAAMKKGTPKRITFSIGSSNVGDFQNIQALIKAQGTGSDSILYKDFKALKDALPAVDAIDLDDENNNDTDSTVKFAVMLGGLGYHVMPDVYTNASYWTDVVTKINTQSPGTVDGVHLQAYAGGTGNDPCSGWDFAGVPVYPGLEDDTLSDGGNATPAQVQSTISGWQKKCGISGGFLWLYDDIKGKTTGTISTTAAYANAFNAGLGSSTPSGAASVYGIYTDQTAFSTGGLDGNGYAYSSNLLGATQSWSGNTFTFGSANGADAWSNATIALPSGQYSALNLLATAVNGNQVSQSFTVNYTDGTSTIITQSLSDWANPQNYAGESKALTMAYRNTSSGGQDSNTFYLYGYSLPINNSKTVKSVLLPSNANVVVLAYALSNTATAAVPVNLSTSFNKTGIYGDATKFAASGGLDGNGYAYSSQLLGRSLVFNNLTFNLGAANAANVLSAAAQTVSLPAGKFSSLQMLATSVNGSQTSQAFTVTYTDGSKSSFSQGISDWFTPQSYGGELEAAKMAYRDGSGGSPDNRTFYLYNYTFALDRGKTIQSIQLPNNAKVQVLAFTLAP
ncbi:hypothetical protein [Dyella silvatica]|uniref:hypothetical protein n=1 Tax=Dyella silvatica TaxID=2992128 RepID=UPI00225C3D9C|nr:hypothetical protein [Dyella silvatica]